MNGQKTHNTEAAPGDLPSGGVTPNTPKASAKAKYAGMDTSTTHPCGVQIRGPRSSERTDWFE